MYATLTPYQVQPGTMGEARRLRRAPVRAGSAAPPAGYDLLCASPHPSLA